MNIRVIKLTMTMFFSIFAFCLSPYKFFNLTNVLESKVCIYLMHNVNEIPTIDSTFSTIPSALIDEIFKNVVKTSDKSVDLKYETAFDFIGYDCIVYFSSNVNGQECLYQLNFAHRDSYAACFLHKNGVKQCRIYLTKSMTNKMSKLVNECRRNMLVTL